MTEREKLEYELLNMIAMSAAPMGSVTLSLLLEESGFRVSSSTVGRLLSELDHRNFTVKQGFKGRVISDEGVKRLNGLKEKHLFEYISTKFLESVDVEGKDSLIDILVARRGIERETARLAAINATKKDIVNLERIIEYQKEQAAHGILTPDQDVQIHHAIAEAGKNKVLMAAYDFIWQNGKLSPVMEYIRTSVGSTIAVDHGMILSAIVNKEPDAAEKRMAEHIDSLIVDVNKYWNKATKNLL